MIEIRLRLIAAGKGKGQVFRSKRSSLVVQKFTASCKQFEGLGMKLGRANTILSFLCMQDALSGAWL